VAARLLNSGVHSVVANSYSIYQRSAKIFVNAFYTHLLKSGSIAAAMQEGRRAMYKNKERDTYYGTVDLEDWIVPVLYQRNEKEDFILHLQPGGTQDTALPEEIQRLGDFGFIGRDRAIHQLERAVRRNGAGILIHGMAGEGKTTLAKGFMQWLEGTNGLGEGAFWLSFEDINNADYVFGTLLEPFMGTEAMVLPVEEKMKQLVEIFKSHKFFIVWDNFESASGIKGTEVTALMPPEERELLKKFLVSLRGGKTKVIITSRAKEAWLPVLDCWRLPLHGLEGEELWQYCNRIVTDLGLSLDRDSDVYRQLMETLGGNPLAVRVMLLRMAEGGYTAPQLLVQLEEGFRLMQGEEGDDEAERILVALEIFDRGLDEAFAPVLELIGLHEHFADVRLIEFMTKNIDITPPISDCFAVLETAGLCHPVQKNSTIYQLHPALRACLARRHPASDDGRRAFVGVMSSFANVYGKKELRIQRYIFTLFSACFHRALQIAEELNMRSDVFFLIQAMGSYAYHVRNFSEAEKQYKRLAEIAIEYNELRWEAVAYNQLGLSAEARRDFATAEGWCNKSLAIELKQGYEQGAASTYHQLGIIAQEQRDFVTAEDCYKKSLDIFLKQGNEHDAAMTYGQLGIMSQEQRDFATAEDWYKKSLAITLKQGNEHASAITYHQLGGIAQEQRDFTTAEDWYKKSLAIELKQGNEHGAALTYGQLGIMAQEQHDFATAEDWYKKSLDITLKQSNEHGSAITYHQLGMIAEEQQDLATAKGLYNKSLSIFKKYNDTHSAAIVTESLQRLTQIKNGGQQ